VGKIVWTILLAFLLIDVSNILLAKISPVEPAKTFENSTEATLNQEHQDFHHDQPQDLISGVTITQGDTSIPTRLDFGSGDQTTESVHSSNLKVKEVLVKYCQSCASYKGSYQQVADYINAKYPTITVTGDNYPPPPTKLLLSKLVTYGQYGVTLLLVAGDWIFKQVGITPPPIYHKIKEKQFIVIMAAMFLGNNLSTSLTSTGAFEVYADNELIFSKLQTGR